MNLFLKEGKVLNIATGKYVNIDGVIGKKIISDLKKKKKISVKKRASPQIIRTPKIEKKRSIKKLDSCILNSKVPLRELQIKTVQHFNENDSLLIVHGTGMGKTLTAVTAAECFLQSDKKNQVTVITSKSLIDSFKDTIQRYGSNNLSRYDIFNYDMYLSVSKSSNATCGKNTMLIVDEVQNLKNLNGKKFEAVLKCAINCGKVLLLTATPYMNSVCDFIPLINLLHKSKLVGTRRNSEYKNYFPGCSRSVADLNKDVVKQQMNQIATYLRGKVSFAEKPLGGDYPTYKFVTMDARGRTQYGTNYEVQQIAMGAKYEKIVHDQVFDIFSHPEKFYNGYRRIVNELGPEGLYNEKFQFIKDNIFDKGKTEGILLFSNWLEYGVEVIEKFLAKNNITFRTITGETPVEDRQKAVNEYNQRKVSALIISNAGATGLDLKGTRIEIVLDPPWNLAQLDQILGRGVRYMSHSHLPPNQRNVEIYLLCLVEKSFLTGAKRVTTSGDFLVYQIVKKKRVFNEIVESVLKRISIV